MEKITKRLLFISDDFNKYSWKGYYEILKDGEYYFEGNSNWLLFKCDIVTTIKEGLELRKQREYDLVLIDYGLVGNELKDFKKICEKEFVVYTGALDKHYIMNDIERSPYNLPQLEFMRFGVNDLKSDLYGLFNKIKDKELGTTD